MQKSFPNAVPEIPVTDTDAALDYYEKRLGFGIDWRAKEDGISGVSRGQCRLFLTDPSFRDGRTNSPPVVVWINLGSKAEVDALHEEWRANGATIASPPESKPWMLHEFTAVDPDGNFFRVFYDFSSDT